MKKAICMILSAVLVLGLCACGGGGGNEAQASLKAGWGRVNITPQYPVPMAGYSNRVSEGYRDYLYATCIAVSDGNETVLMYTLDLLNANGGTMADEYRVAITSATGIPADRIFIGATHTHSGGQVLSNDAAGKQFKQDVLNAVAQAGQEALADMAPCRFLKAQQTLEGMNFVRHYKLEDGSYKGSNFNEDSLSPVVGHADEPDKQLTLLKFDREEGKKDILFVGWQAHPDHAYANGFNTLSADFPGAMREALEYDNEDLLVGYYGGASGDVNTFSEIKELNHGLGMTEYGEKLAQLVTEAMAKLEPVEGTTVKATTKVHTFSIDHSWDHMITQAREISTIFSTQGRDAATKEGVKYGFSSAYHANAIISRVSMGASENRTLGAFCIGDVGFIEAKCEMFSASAKYVKQNSPFSTTVVIAGNSTYIPRAEAYDYHCYEADTSLFEKGSAEKMSEAFVEMLKSLK